MARGPKLHLKRLNAPKNWHLSKLKGIYAPKPSSGPHKSDSCLPLLILLRNHLSYCSTAAEAKLILERGHVLVNGKVRVDPSYPAGLLDVIQIPAMKKSFRLIYTSSGDFKSVATESTAESLAAPLPQQILASATSSDSLENKSAPMKKKKETLTKKEALKNLNLKSLLLLKVAKTGMGNKKMVGYNRAASKNSKNYEGEKMIPWLSTECGKIFRFVDKDIKKFDTVMVEVSSEQIKSNRKYQLMNFKSESVVKGFLKMEEGKMVMVNRGKNKGRVGKIKHVEKHEKISDVVFVEDEMGNSFVTKKEDVIVIGEDKSIIGLDGSRGVRMSLEEKCKWGLRNRDRNEEVFSVEEE